MKPAPKLKRDLLLASGWRISRVRSSLRTRDRAGLIAFIRQRHKERFFDPIQHLREAEKNEQGYGFAIMALCSLLVETIQSYRDGLPTTYRAELGLLRTLKDVPGDYVIPASLRVSGREVFRRFFEHFHDEFDGMSGLKFYKNIRNGLLHQAQTKRGWTIAVRKSCLHSGKVIDRNIFASRLGQAFESYLSELSNREWDNVIWRNVRRKIWWLIRLS